MLLFNGNAPAAKKKNCHIFPAHLKGFNVYILIDIGVNADFADAMTVAMWSKLLHTLTLYISYITL